MRILAVLLLAPALAFAQVPLKDQPIPEAQKKALADHAAKRATEKNDRAWCRDTAVKTNVPNLARIVEWHKMIEAECMKAKGYR